MMPWSHNFSKSQSYIQAVINENIKTTMPKTTRMIPVTLFNVAGSALLANTAAILAHTNVNITHKASTGKSGIPPITKCETAPVSAVNVIIKTLVPTAVLSS